MAKARFSKNGITFNADVYPDEDGFFVARCVQLDIASQGKTVDEAIENLKEATELYLDAYPEKAALGNRFFVSATFEVLQNAKITPPVRA